MSKKNYRLEPEYREKQRLSHLGDKNPNWKGGIKKINGYIYIYQPHHPFSTKGGYIFEHRLVMEKYIKRFLLSNEIVHHINGIKNDNHIKNLQLLANIGEHNKIHKTK